MEEDGVENLWAKTPSQATYFLSIFLYCHIILFVFFHSRSRSRVFLGMIASDSHSRNVGMDFFHSLPVPEFWESIFSCPSHSRILGMASSHSLPAPEFWECVFSISFPFPNFGNGIIHSRSRSRTPKSHSRSPLGENSGVMSELFFSTDI